MIFVFTLTLIIVLFIFVFARESFDQIFLIKIIAGFSFLGIVTYIALPHFDDQKITGTIEFLVGFAYFFLMVESLGNIYSYWFSLVYLFIIAACLYSLWLGLSFVVITIGYFLFHALGVASDQLFAFYGSQMLPLIIVSVLSILVGIEYRKALARGGSFNLFGNDNATEKSANAAILANIGDAIYAVDKNRQIILFNKEAEKIVGWKIADAIGLPCKKVMNLMDDKNNSVCEKSCPVLESWSLGLKVDRDDLCLINQRNKNVKIDGSYSPIKNDDGKMVGAICVFRDVTQKKETERMRSEFISTASHEMRTPITAVSGYLELAMNPTICRIDEKAMNYLKKAHDTTRNMSSLIQNLLIVTKIEDKRLESKIENFQINDLAKEVVEIFKKKAAEKGLELDLDNEASPTMKGKVIDRTLQVKSDREQIREVLNNLIENAVKFTETGGVTVSITYEPEFATICVADTGLGISEEGQKHLFEKFYQVDNTSTRNFNGNGLGLFITRSIVENLGGKIWLESRPGRGSKFYFTIPRSV